MKDENGIPIKNLAYVVQSALNQMFGKAEDVSWFEQIAIQWFTEEARGVTALPCLKVKKLQVSASKQVLMPDDLMRYTKIAIDYGGKLWTLTLDENITLPPHFDCNNTTASEAENQAGGVWFQPYLWDGAYNGGVFALGGGFNQAYYRYDPSSRTLSFLDNLVGREIIIEYLSNGRDVNSQSLIPEYYHAPLRWWLCYMAATFRASEYPFDPNQFKNHYDNAMIDAAVGTGPTYDEILDAYYKGCGFSVR